MTLILSAITPRWAIQVSDRRVTYLATGALKDPLANKAIIFNNKIAFGYTGLAELEGDRTDYWLASVLQILPIGMPLSDVADVIARKAEIAVRASSAKQSSRHVAFSGVGWAPNDSDGSLNGIVYTIENCYDADFALLATPRADFQVHSKTFDRSQSDWYSVGMPLNPKEKKALRRNFVACAHRKLGPTPIVRLFAELIRSVASRSSAVGKDLMVTAIPKRAAETNAVVLSGHGGYVAPSHGVMLSTFPLSRPREAMFFGYMPANSLDPITYFPCVVASGALTIFSLSVSPTISAAGKKFLSQVEGSTPR